MAERPNLQDSFLNELRKEHVEVVIFLVHGFQLRGVIRSFDSFTILLDHAGKEQLVYKHAISTLARAHHAPEHTRV